MNKELIVAIGIGALLGLGVAIYVSNVPTSKTPSIQTSTTKLSITPKDVSIKQTTFVGLPKLDEIRPAKLLTISGTAEKDTVLFVQTLLKTTPVTVTKNKFSAQIALKPGYNEIIITTHKKNGDQAKVLKFFHLAKVEVTPIPTEKQSTSEASLLKDKLEQKVLELRSNAQKAFYGTITEITEKSISLKNESDKLKVTVEPEVTKIYDAATATLDELELSDLKKGMYMTVFLSDIAGEEKSYTMYREPNQVLVSGKISNVSETGFEVTMVNYEKTTIKADVDSTTTQSVYTIATGDTGKYGFSKLKIGDDIFAVLNTNSDGTFTIDRYLVANQK